jgi:hypothetical protein
MNNSASIRPSNLPKLAECPNYKPQKDAGPAAARGTLLDGVFRAIMQGATELSVEITPDDFAAVQWAKQTLTLLAGGEQILTNEEDCVLFCPGIERPGTADAMVPTRRIGADLKSGSIRNYREQMAAYALAAMEKHFEEEWTMFLLFCDQKEVVEHHFTLLEARQVVFAVIAAASVEDPIPSPCEYCKWCDRQTSCPVVVKPATEALAISAQLTTEAFDFEAVLTNPRSLSDFLNACEALDTYREKAKQHARDLLAENPNSVPGWKLKKGAQTQIVDHIQIGKYLSLVGSGPLLAAIGSMSAKTFREVWERQLPNDPFPADCVTKKPANKPSLTKA